MKRVERLITLIITVCLTFLNYPLQVSAETADGPSIQISHSRINMAEAGKTVPITATITDREGVELVRIYFKTVESKEYFFVPMIVTEGNTYYGLLPAPLKEADGIEYLFLVKTYNNRVFISQTFTTKIDTATIQPNPDETDTLDALTEAREHPAQIEGFDPNTRIRLVAKHEKHGVVAGLYDNQASGGTASTGQFHGQINASGKSNKNTLMIAGGVAAGALAIALIVGGGGGSSSSSEIPPTGKIDSSGVGLWSLDYSNDPCTKITTQVVECSPEGLVTDVSPTAIGVPLPDSCENAPFAGLSEVFIIGGTCDTAIACSNYTAPDVLSKTCAEDSMIFTRQGVRIERWSVQ
jgi:hypothetical protein